MVVQLATPRKLGDNLGILVTGDPLPVVLLGFEFHESCYNNTHARSGGIWISKVLFVAVRAHCARK